MCWEIIGHSALYAAAQVGTYEKALVKEGVGILGAAVRGRTFGMEMMEMDVMEFACTLAKRLDEDMGDAGNAGKMDVVSAPYG